MKFPKQFISGAATWNLSPTWHHLTDWFVYLFRFIHTVILHMYFKYSNSNTYTAIFSYLHSNIILTCDKKVVEIDGESGEILSSLHSTNGAVRFIAEAFIMDR